MRQVSEPILKSLSEVVGLDVRDAQTQIPRSIVENVVRLSQFFTRDRGDQLQRYFDDPSLASAYLAYFFPVNLAKVQELLDEQLPVLRSWVKGRTVRVLELGCGPGTGVLGVMDWALFGNAMEGCRLHCVAVDQSQQALHICQNIWNRYASLQKTVDHVLTPIRCDLHHGLGAEIQRAGGHEGYDLIIIQNLLNEMHVGRADRIRARGEFVMSALRLLAPHGSIMLIEPALRSSSRELHQVRDWLLEAGGCNLYSPCLHEHPCPALQKPTDWCHEERSWDPPPWIQAVDARVGFIKDALKFSYALLRKDGQTIVRRGENVFRLVSELRVFKGETRAWLCNETGRFEVGCLSKERSLGNEAFEHSERGCILKIDGIVRKEKNGRPALLRRIPASGGVEIQNPGGTTYSASGSVPP